MGPNAQRILFHIFVQTVPKDESDSTPEPFCHPAICRMRPSISPAARSKIPTQPWRTVSSCWVAQVIVNLRSSAPMKRVPSTVYTGKPKLHLGCGLGAGLGVSIEHCRSDKLRAAVVADIEAKPQHKLVVSFTCPYIQLQQISMS